jgi:N-acetylmuramic acid 6-phosphate (MurNAc-6-P) etherase
MQTHCWKLRDRARRVVMEMSGVTSEEAERALDDADGNIREAVAIATLTKESSMPTCRYHVG